MGIGNLEDLLASGLDTQQLTWQHTEVVQTLQRASTIIMEDKSESSSDVEDQEWQKRISDNPFIMETVEGIWANYDTENIGYLKKDNARNFLQ